MTTAKNTYTNATALAKAIELLTLTCDDAELLDKLGKMHATAIKPRKATDKAPSKDKLANQANARKLHALMIEGEVYGSDWVMTHGDCIITAQKATGVMREGMAMGLFVKADPVKGKVRYAKA